MDVRAQARIAIQERKNGIDCAHPEHRWRRRPRRNEPQTKLCHGGTRPYFGLEILGGAYLVFLGYSIWRSARKPLRFAEGAIDEAANSIPRSFCSGVLTQVSNPKTAVVYASILVSLMPREVSRSALLVLPPLIFVIEAGWCSIVALALSASSPRAAYLHSKAWIDRAAGGVMALVGIKLVMASKQL